MAAGYQEAAPGRVIADLEHLVERVFSRARTGLGVGVMTLDTHGRLYGLHPQGWSSLQDEALRSTALLGAPRKTLRRYPEDTTRSV